MTLETINNQTNIKEIIISEKQDVHQGSRNLLQTLKGTPLYEYGPWGNETRGVWNDSMDSGQNLDNYRAYAKDQLLFILVESLFDKKAALELFDGWILDLFEADDGLWHTEYDHISLFSKDYQTEPQLLDILIQSKFEMVDANGKYSKLKNSSLYNKELKFWYIGTKQEESEGMFTTPQLMSVLVESLTDKEESFAHYQELKSKLYGKKSNLWYNVFVGIAPLKFIDESEKFTSTNQLLGVLVEAQFNEPVARKQYELLKQMTLYDPQYKQWIWSIDPNTGEIDQARYTFPQLLGVWCEYLFEQQEDNSPTIAVPARRVF